MVDALENMQLQRSCVRKAASDAASLATLCEITLGSLDCGQLLSRRHHQELVHAGAVRFRKLLDCAFSEMGKRSERWILWLSSSYLPQYFRRGSEPNSESVGCAFVILVVKADNGIGATIDGGFQYDFITCVGKLRPPLVVNFNRHNYVE